jgi:hypothetical protein
MPAPFFEGEQILFANLALLGPVEEMLAELRRKVHPLDLRHQAPNVILASSSRSRSVSAGSVDFWNRSARSKKASRRSSDAAKGSSGWSALSKSLVGSAMHHQDTLHPTEARRPVAIFAIVTLR